MTATQAAVRTQRQAAQAPLGLLDDHLRRCVADAGGSGDVAVPPLALQQLPADTTNELCALDITERI